jgi:hypothetical protein
MDYARAYDFLMQRASGRVLLGYSEKHHIVPKCMGGSDRKENIVRLTAREHFIAHRLLTRLFPEVPGVWYALIAMGRIPGVKGRIFASERERAAVARRGFKYSLESRKKMSEAKKGKPSVSPKTRFQKGQTAWSAGNTGQNTPGYGTKRTLTQRQRMSEAQKACGNRPPSRKGIKWTEAQKALAKLKRQTNLLKGESV